MTNDDQSSNLIQAVLCCGHSINAGEIVLKYSEKQDGDNALSQLHKRIASHLSGMWKSMEAAPLDGTEVLVWDGFGISLAAYEADTTFEDFLTFCNEGEGEQEWREYVDENPGRGWMANEPISGDFIFLEPIAWMELPAPPRGLKQVGHRSQMAAALIAGER